MPVAPVFGEPRLSQGEASVGTFSSTDAFLQRPGTSLAIVAGPLRLPFCLTGAAPQLMALGCPVDPALLPPPTPGDWRASLATCATAEARADGQGARVCSHPGGALSRQVPAVGCLFQGTNDNHLRNRGPNFSLADEITDEILPMSAAF